ncbi:MAG TPA: Druantia anti-phage system protein DruA, partial [Nannocystis sp.]
RRRYASAESEIASSVAGRSIMRAPKLVLLGTTSLYGVGSSQYNRIKIPVDRIGGANKDVIRFEELGRSEAFGTSHYSEETVDALVDLVQQSEEQRVNSIFGEGASPKLRKVRQALDLLNLPTGLLLRHYRPRVVYGVSLIRNLEDYLIGLARKPDYIIPLNEGPAATAQTGAWWRERWLRNRIASDEVLEEVARHTRVHPITHGARVVQQPASSQQPLFAEPS